MMHATVSLWWMRLLLLWWMQLFHCVLMRYWNSWFRIVGRLEAAPSGLELKKKRQRLAIFYVAPPAILPSLRICAYEFCFNALLNCVLNATLHYVGYDFCCYDGYDFYIIMVCDFFIMFLMRYWNSWTFMNIHE